MTVLIGASVLLIAASAIVLVFGWATANESLIWTSIVASAAAAVALALAFFRSRQEAAALSRGAPAGTPAERGAAPQAEGADNDAEGAATEVVAVKDSQRYHRPDCRYARTRHAATMTKATAHKEGFRPCGVCRP